VTIKTTTFNIRKYTDYNHNKNFFIIISGRAAGSVVTTATTGAENRENQATGNIQAAPSM
jgi:hypothetical protein